MRIVSALVAAVAILIMAQTAMAQGAPEAPAVPKAAAAPGMPNVVVLNPQSAEPSMPAPDHAVSPAAPEAPRELNADEAPGTPEDNAQTAASDNGDAEGPSAAPEGSNAPVEPTAPSKAADSTPPPAKPTLTVDIDLTKQRMHVTENGLTVHTWPISSGRYAHETPTGTFQPTWMAKMWYSRQYDYSPMPHSIFFHGGAAIHGTYYTSQLGRAASAGCVRLAPKNAASLYKLVTKHGKNMTRIVVHGTAKTSPPAVASYRRAPRYAEWGDDDVYYAPPPAYYRRRPYYGYSEPYYAPVRKRRGAYVYQAPRGRYAKRGLFNSYGGYGF